MCTLSQFYDPLVRVGVSSCFYVLIPLVVTLLLPVGDGGLASYLFNVYSCVCFLYEMHAQVLNDGHKFCAGGYGCPVGDGGPASYLAQISNLPRQEAPEVFGLHSNAAIAFNLQVCVLFGNGTGFQCLVLRCEMCRLCIAPRVHDLCHYAL